MLTMLGLKLSALREERSELTNCCEATPPASSPLTTIPTGVGNHK